MDRDRPALGHDALVRGDDARHGRSPADADGDAAPPPNQPWPDPIATRTAMTSTVITPAVRPRRRDEGTGWGAALVMDSWTS